MVSRNLWSVGTLSAEIHQEISIQELISEFSPAASGLDGYHFLALSLVILVAAIIRGYAGFGFSAIVVAAGSLFLPTREVVPMVLLLEVIASLQMARQVWPDVHWRLVLSILGGSILFIPIGQYLLLWIPVEPMRIVAAMLLLSAVALTAIGISIKVRNAPPGWILVGTVSGLMNGLLAMGGMWAMILLLSSGIRVATLRASLVALFFTTDAYAILTGTGQGLVNSNIMLRFIWVLPALFVGVWLGSHRFEGSDAYTYRRVVLTVLAFLAVLLLARASYTAHN